MARKKARRAKKIAPKRRPSWWDQRSSTEQHILCVLALLAVALYFCWPTVFSGKYLIGGDTVHWRATAESMIEHRQTTGEEPLWATNVFGGMPGVMISPPPKVFQADYLPGWLRTISWPFSHTIVLLLGAYLLLWYLTKEKLLGLLAACAYGLTTYLPVILVAGHNTKYVALAYAPWLLLAFIHVMRRPGVLASLLFAAALAVSLRAGHVQIPYYVGIIGLIYWIGALIGSIKESTTKQFVWTSVWIAAGTLIALLMVAQIYWPTYEYKGFSIRGMASGGGEGALVWGYSMAWSQGWSELTTLLISDALGGASPLYWGPKTFTSGPHYLGGIVLLFAGLAVWRIRSWAVGSLGVAAVLMTLFSLGDNFELLSRVMFAYFPFFDAFRAPETWLIAVALVMSILAALGLGYVIRSEKSSKEEAAKTRAIYLAAAATLGLTALLFVGRDVFYSFERPGEREQVLSAASQQFELPASDPNVVRAVDDYLTTEIKEPRKEAFNGDALRTLLFLILATGGLFLFRRQIIPAWGVQALIVLLVIIDLGGVAQRYFSEDDLSPQGETSSRVQAYDVDTFILEKYDEAGGEGSFRVLSLLNPDPAKDARPSYYHESLGGYSGAKLRLYQDYLDHILIDPSTGAINDNALDMMNTRYLIGFAPIPGTEVVFNGEQLLVLENPDALPRAALVGEVEIIEESEAVWERLRDPAFDPGRVVILEALPDAPVAPIDSGSVVKVTIEEYGPREISLSVDTDLPRLLLLSEVYYPAGWSASVNGEEVPIYRANYLFRAIPVPAGSSEVDLRFDPVSYTAGGWISNIATLLVYLSILAMCGYSWYRRRNRT